MKTILFFIFSFVFLLLPVCSGAEDYIVGDGDVLTLNVYENEDLSTKVRVSADDTIRIPLIGEISVAGLNVSQISSKIEKLLADGYLVNPQVDVFINEYRSKKAIILGQIRNPGLYELRGKTTLLEFISKAGGLTSEAGNRATIKRKTPDKAKEQDNIPIDLEQLIEKGDTSLNLPIKDGDTLYISKADIYYVSGEVKKPDSYKYESGITIIKAITQAGGFSKIAAKNKVSIIRIVNGKKTIIENVKMDERVYPDDVIVVPESFF